MVQFSDAAKDVFSHFALSIFRHAEAIPLERSFLMMHCSGPAADVVSHFVLSFFRPLERSFYG